MNSKCKKKTLMYICGCIVFFKEYTSCCLFRYNDGLDKWRLTAREVREEFKKKEADVVYAFQTRNPTHAGHAYLMKTAGQKLRDQVGSKNKVSYDTGNIFGATPDWKG